MPIPTNNRALILMVSDGWSGLKPALAIKNNQIIPFVNDFTLGDASLPINRIFARSLYFGSNSGSIGDNGGGIGFYINGTDYINIRTTGIEFKKLVDFKNNVLKGLPDPSLDDEAATKKYVDDNSGIKISNYTHIIPNGDTNDVVDIFKDYFTDQNLQPNKSFDIDFFIRMDSISGSRLTAEQYQLVFKIGAFDSVIGVGEYINDNLGSFGWLYRFKFYCDANTRVWYNNEGSIQKDNLTVTKTLFDGATFSPKANILTGNSFEIQQVTSKGQMTINAVIKEY